MNSEPSEFHLIQASAICRQLLLEEQPLLRIVERITGQPTKFQTKAVGLIERVLSLTPTMPGIVSAAHSIGPSKTDFPIVVLDWDEFLKLKILAYEGDFYTVKEIIKYCANVAGGIHHSSKDQKL